MGCGWRRVFPQLLLNIKGDALPIIPRVPICSCRHFIFQLHPSPSHRLFPRPINYSTVNQAISLGDAAFLVLSLNNLVNPVPRSKHYPKYKRTDPSYMEHHLINIWSWKLKDTSTTELQNKTILQIQISQMISRPGVQRDCFAGYVSTGRVSFSWWRALLSLLSQPASLLVGCLILKDVCWHLAAVKIWVASVLPGLFLQ